MTSGQEGPVASSIPFTAEDEALDMAEGMECIECGGDDAVTKAPIITLKDPGSPTAEE